MRGVILEKAEALREPGMPFWPIFYLPELEMTLGNFHLATSMDFQLKYPTHREKAVQSALPYLATLTN
jgi:hypothetical protein